MSLELVLSQWLFKSMLNFLCLGLGPILTSNHGCLMISFQMSVLEKVAQGALTSAFVEAMQSLLQGNSMT